MPDDKWQTLLESFSGALGEVFLFAAGFAALGLIASLALGNARLGDSASRRG